MGKTTIEVSTAVIEQQLFEAHPYSVEIVNVRYNPDRRLLELDIEGIDIPDADQCSVIMHKHKPLTMEFQPIVPPPPVNRDAVTLVDGAPVTDDHRELKENGQQKGYVVLSAEERAKGFVRPVRRSYVHVGTEEKKGCGTVTHMSQEIAETYARDPKFYSGTFCVGCHKHLPLDQFVWDGTSEMVGS